MSDTLHILIADYVPIANKGEEAIVRGIEEMLSNGRPVSLGLFGDVADVTHNDNITIFPRDWVFRFEGNSGLSGYNRILTQAIIAMQLRLGIYSKLKNLTPSGHQRCRALQDFFEKADYVLVGHDGVFCVESCGVIHLAKKHGKRTGILGASTGIGGGRFYKAGLYRDAVAASDFCFFRERFSCESIRQICRLPDKLMVAPDPAFAMSAASSDQAAHLLECHEGYRAARTANRPVVAVTVLEKGRVYAGFRPDLEGQAKREAHARYVAEILEALVQEHGVFIVLLPHSVEENGSDVVAARHVAEQMTPGSDNHVILEEDCGARLLKAIIRECDFLVGERTHSLIGSVSVTTPFMALTNRQDTRTHGIIGEMCRCKHQIVDMDVADSSVAARRAADLFASRVSIRKSLRQIRQELSEQIERVARMVEGPRRARPSR